MNPVTVHVSDADIALLVRLSAAIAAGGELEVRDALQQCAGAVSDVAVEEIILQSYLFCGFPRALNAAREWRRLSGKPAPPDDAGAVDNSEVRVRGEETCAVVYGESYDKLRANIRALHPALDEWMIVEGYGKVLSRPTLQLYVRELCVVAACAAAKQERQLHSHLHGALNAGATEMQLLAALSKLDQVLDADTHERAVALAAKVIKGRRS